MNSKRSSETGAINSKVELEQKIIGAGPGRRSKLYTVYLIAVLLLAYTFSFVDRQILSLLVEPMKRDLLINDTQMSLLQGLSFAIFYTLLGLPLGRVADTKSRRGLIAVGVFLWSIMTAVCGLAQNFWQLFLARMGVGVGEAALSPAAYSLITDSVDRKHLGTAIGVYTMGIYLGGGLALILGGMVVEWAEGIRQVELPVVGEIFSWQLVFLCVGLPGLLLTPLIFTLREPARSHVGVGDSAISVAEVIKYFKANKRTLMLINVGAAFASLAAYGTLAWAPTLLIRNYGLNASEAGLAFGVIVLVSGAGGVICGGLISDRWNRLGQQDAKIRVAMIAGLCGLLPTFVYPMLASLPLVLLLMAIATFFGNFMMALGPAAMQEIVPESMRGQFSALYLFVVNLIGLGIGPTAVALCTDFAFGDQGNLALSLVIVPTLALAFSSFLLWRSLPSYRALLMSNKT